MENEKKVISPAKARALEAAQVTLAAIEIAANGEHVGATMLQAHAVAMGADEVLADRVAIVADNLRRGRNIAKQRIVSVDIVEARKRDRDARKVGKETGHEIVATYLKAGRTVDTFSPDLQAFAHANGYVQEVAQA